MGSFGWINILVKLERKLNEEINLNLNLKQLRKKSKSDLNPNLKQIGKNLNQIRKDLNQIRILIA